MKRLPIIVLTFALCLLIAGCGAKPNEPADGDSAKAGIVERMATVKAEEIKYISSFFSREHVSAEDMASVLNAAAEHHSEQPGQGLDHYTMEIYLSGGPDAYNSSDEHFVFFAGLDENHINGIYFNGKGDSHRMSFEDETLYWLIRNGYRTEVQVDKDAYEYHQAILDQRAQRLAAQCASPSRTDILTGYEVVQFYQKEVLTDESGSYTVYCWEPAFLTASPDDIPWAGGMYLDADGRLCAYEQYTYFVTKGEPGDFPPYRFLPLDLYNGETEEAGKEHALQRIRQAFEPAIQAHWAEDVLDGISDYHEVSVSTAEPLARVLLSCEYAVKDFKVLGIEASMSSSLSFFTEELYALDELTPERPLLLNMTFYGLLPYYGVSYVNGSGETISYSINMSGKDGSVILTEFLPCTQCGTASNGRQSKTPKRNRQKSVALFHCLPHTAQNAAGRQAKRRKSAA